METFKATLCRFSKTNPHWLRWHLGLEPRGSLDLKRD